MYAVHTHSLSHSIRWRHLAVGDSMAVRTTDLHVWLRRARDSLVAVLPGRCLRYWLRDLPVLCVCVLIIGILRTIARVLRVLSWKARRGVLCVHRRSLSLILLRFCRLRKACYGLLRLLLVLLVRGHLRVWEWSASVYCRGTRALSD